MIRISEAAEAVAASAGNKATYAGGATALYGGFTSHEVIGLAGLVIACIGALINFYFKHRADVRDDRITKLREEYIRRGRLTDTDLGKLEFDE